MPVRQIPLLQNYIYHIYNRWFEKMSIFRSKSDFERFLILMQKYLWKYPSIKVYSYSILPNHFHFIVQTTWEGKDISEYIWKIQQSYSMYFKIKYKNLIPGLKWISLFEWRFKAKLIETDEYLHQCLAYVNYNPVKHKLVKNIEDYPYTSYHQIVLGKEWIQVTWDYKEDIRIWKDIELTEMEF